MKEWAIENGATHYCHWFQPLNGLTAKKHEAFLDRSEEREPIIRFSGKELIKGEPDASSFPSGGMRSTFEARGYTYWDCTANTFIIDNIMYIPSIFVSFTGETLDKKGPLLKASDYVSDQGIRVVNLFSDRHVYRLRTKVGLEQEFFLIDKSVYDRRADLKNTGRTLIGRRPGKTQELSDHYFGAIPERVAAFYREVNKDLWELGVYAKTEHNEVAPCQFEVAILYENANIAVDDNLILMEVLKKNAKKFGLVCLLHEKPFKHVNGSGKHNNWSLSTNYGENCFDPGERPEENVLFLLFICAVLRAVDRYATLLRFAASCPGNDHRLGADEAPPSIVSIYFGDQLEGILLDLIDEPHPSQEGRSKINIRNLGYAPHDDTDRNRTSPFAFTGNKFEFRMLGSSKSAADSNIVLNTCVGDELRMIADELEGVATDRRREYGYEICRKIIKEHKRILFDGDGYSQEWVEEAARRGLPNVRSFYESARILLDNEVVDLFVRSGIYMKKEIEALYRIALEEVINTGSVEIATFLDMINKEVIPALCRELMGAEALLGVVENRKIRERAEKINRLLESIIEDCDELEENFSTKNFANFIEKADSIFQLSKEMERIRTNVDRAEEMLSAENIRIPTYEQILQSLE
jgi:glutamine synthetase